MPISCAKQGLGASGFGWWGFGYGTTVYGSAIPPGGDLPHAELYDLYCIGPCTGLEYLPSYNEVTLSPLEQTRIDDELGAYVFESGMTSGADEAYLQISHNTPNSFTLQMEFMFLSLPEHPVTEVGDADAYIMVSSLQGTGVCIRFSKLGIEYGVCPEGAFTMIPESLGWVVEGERYILRIVMDHTNNAVWVYLTDEAVFATTGHILRAVLHTEQPDSCPVALQDETCLAIFGTESDPVSVALRVLCLSSSLLVPALRPVAIVSRDQAIRFCSIAKLDGTASFDPNEDGGIDAYHWRLVDGPSKSSWVLDGYSGSTYQDDPATGWTDKFYSSAFSGAAPWPLVEGDVLNIDGELYDVLTSGIDGYGTYAQITRSILPDNLVNRPFKLLKQDGLSGADSAIATFYPDVLGFFKFDLTVFNSALLSLPASTVVSALANSMPRGVVPDLSFFWGYLSDFWGLVEGREIFTTMWSALAQVVASELLYLWQIEYSKSLRDIQRTLVRRWLYYDPLISFGTTDLTRVGSLPVDEGYIWGIRGEPVDNTPGLDTYTYKCEEDLLAAGVLPGDLLVVGSDTYRVLRVVSDPSDAGINRRAVCTTTLPLTAGSTWAIYRLSDGYDLNVWSQLVDVGDDVAVEIVDISTDESTYVMTKVAGLHADVPTKLALHPAPFLSYVDTTKYTLKLVGVVRRRYIPIDPLVVDVPFLQAVVNTPAEEEVLRRNLDFFLESARGVPCIRFDTGVWVHRQDDGSTALDTTPPTRLWAEYTYLDNRAAIEANFGLAVDFSLDDLAALPSSVDYLGAVRGLWYAHLNAPTLYNARVGAQILLGLPFAEEEGVIEELRTDPWYPEGRFLIRDKNEQAIVRSYTYPVALPIEINPSTNAAYKTGDTVYQFAPLVGGVEVVDWVKEPLWWRPYAKQGSLTELHKFFRFLVRVDAEAFNLPAVLFAREFIHRIKPTYTLPLLVVHRDIEDSGEIDVQADPPRFTISFHIYDTPRSGINRATMFDQPNDGPFTDGVLIPQLMQNTFDTEDPLVDGYDWAFDVITPGDEAFALLMQTTTGGFEFDGIWYFDEPVYTDSDLTLEHVWTFDEDDLLETTWYVGRQLC